MQFPFARSVGNDVLIALVNEKIDAVFSGIDRPELRRALQHATSGGKRIRPVLTMLSCAAAGGRESDAVEPAAAVELLHAASLVHDDIMDGSDLRRGEPTLHILHGISGGILVGDTLIALAFRLLAGSALANRQEIMEEFSASYLHLCEGQSDDIAFSGGDPLDVDRHRDMVRKKTAELVGASMAMGAMAASSDRHRIEALRGFGVKLGMAYQVKDDLLEVTGREDLVGKRLGTDIRNGRRTYLTMAYPEVDTVARASNIVSEFTVQALLDLQALPETWARMQLASIAEMLAGREF
jgi:geranylgeranyl pyrophosphate synthase